jgi:hypothetical protein
VSESKQPRPKDGALSRPPRRAGPEHSGPFHRVPVPCPGKCRSNLCVAIRSGHAATGTPCNAPHRRAEAAPTLGLACKGRFRRERSGQSATGSPTPIRDWPSHPLGPAQRTGDSILALDQWRVGRNKRAAGTTGGGRPFPRRGPLASSLGHMANSRVASLDKHSNTHIRLHPECGIDARHAFPS